MRKNENDIKSKTEVDSKQAIAFIRQVTSKIFAFMSYHLHILIK